MNHCFPPSQSESCIYQPSQHAYLVASAAENGMFHFSFQASLGWGSLRKENPKSTFGISLTSSLSTKINAKLYFISHLQNIKNGNIKNGFRNQKSHQQHGEQGVQGETNNCSTAFASLMADLSSEEEVHTLDGTFKKSARAREQARACTSD